MNRYLAAAKGHVDERNSIVHTISIPTAIPYEMLVGKPLLPPGIPVDFPYRELELERDFI